MRRVVVPGAAKDLLVGFALVGIVACASTTEPIDPSLPALALEQPLPAEGQSARRVAQIHFYADPLLVDVPPTATAGTPFIVAVTTYGGGCIGEDTTVVKVDGDRADVVPYQRVYRPGPNGACTMELRVTRREVAVTFPTAGTRVVRVIGRETPAGTLIKVPRVVSVRASSAASP